MKEIEQKIIQTIKEHAEDLLRQNWDGISSTLKDTPDGKINIGLTVALDWSEAAPKVKTSLTYSRKWKDEREDELEDPNQTTLTFSVPPDVEASAEPPAETEAPATGGVTITVGQAVELKDAVEKVIESKARRGRKAKAA